MRIIFFTFYYPPDLCAGSFRAVALVNALKGKISKDDELHVITTHPNRYSDHNVKADDLEVDDNVVIHRIAIPAHNSGMLGQSRTFVVFARAALHECRQLNPDFIIGTTSRLMTGVLSWYSSQRVCCQYFIDLRDIFSETISDIFVRKSKLLGFIVKRFFSFFEKQILTKATGVNVVSQGFPEYFEDIGVDTSNWTFFPNGVDGEFIDFHPIENNEKHKVTTILYAGNIGGGQGLENIIPAVAKRLGNSFRFIIVGSGSTVNLLQNNIQQELVDNVELLPPVGRYELLDYYQQADVLFLHLNDISAFRRVLPSKIFEYAALGKPVVAGVSGYSAQFLRDNVPYTRIFEPSNVIGGVGAVIKAISTEVDTEVVEQFVTLYSREIIMDKMAEYLIGIMDATNERTA